MSADWTGTWKDLFAPHILQRGYNYYQEGRVWDLVRQGNVITALVSGTDEYSVTVQLDDETKGIIDIDCDCPYAEDGSHCKHEAAVLYQLGEAEAEASGTEIDSPLDDLRKKIQEEKAELEEIIDRIPEDEIRSMVYQLALRDDALKNRIRSQYRETISAQQLQQLKETIRNIRYAYGDRHGFVDWRNASGYIRALDGFLYDNVQPLIDRNLFEPAFALTCEVFMTIGNTDIDDDGDVDIGAQTCLEFWGKIADSASDEFQKTMYWWFENHIGDESVIDYMEDYLKEFLLTGFHSEELLQIRLEDLDELIHREESRIREHPDRRFRTFGFDEHVRNRIQTMKDLRLSDDEILTYYQKYDYLPRVLLALAEEYRDAGDTKKAVDLLVAGKDRDAENADVASDYSKRLIEIYREMGDKQRLVAELLFQITSYHQSSLHYVEELKQEVAPESWPAFRKQILDADTCSRIRKDLFVAERMLPELMEEVIGDGSTYTLDRYEKILRPQYADQIRDMYADLIRKGSDRASDRRGYRHQVQELKKLTRYEGGREIARSIAAEWRSMYARRPAFMDELRKAGF